MLIDLAETLAGEDEVGTVGSSTTGVTITETPLPPVAEVPPAATVVPVAEVPPAATVVPVAEVPPAATVVPVAEVPVVPVAVDLDSAGLPWDARINPTSKGLLKTGARANCWKYKKQLDTALIEQVEAELRAAQGATVPPVAATVAATVPPVPPVATGADFPAMLVKVTALMNAERITADQVEAIIKPWGLVSFPLLATRPDLIPNFDTELDRLCPPIQ
jgi:hypothetical protein